MSSSTKASSASSPPSIVSAPESTAWRVASGTTVQYVRDVEVLRGQGVVPASADHLLDVVRRPDVVVLSWGAVVREAVEVDLESVEAAAEIGDVVVGAAVQHVCAVEGVTHEYVVAVPAKDLVRSPLREKHIAGGSASRTSLPTPPRVTICPVTAAPVTRLPAPLNRSGPASP